MVGEKGGDRPNHNRMVVRQWDNFNLQIIFYIEAQTWYEYEK